MKTPVVLLPALLCNAGLFIHQIKALENDFDIFVPDLGLDNDISTTAKRILKQLPEKFILGGISMGGYVALEIIRQAPDRVLGLVLMDTNTHTDTVEAGQKRLKAIELVKNNGIESIIKSSLIDILCPKHQKSDFIVHILSRMAEMTGVEKYENEQMLIMNRKASGALLSKIKCPVLVIGGKEDKLSTVESMEKISKKVPLSTHCIIEDAGHLPPLENPTAVTAVLRSFFEKTIASL